MSSQLPNISGRISLRGCNGGFDMHTGAFKYTELGGGSSFAGPSYWHSGSYINLDANNQCKVYKDDVEHVFGESFSMNAYIKAKQV